MRKTYMRFLACLLTLLLGSMSFAPNVLAAQTSPALPPKLMISEFQTGGLTANGVEDGKMEFIELYNPGAASLDITGWKLEYLSASHTGVASPTRTLLTLEGRLMPQGYLLASYENYLTQADEYFGIGSTASSGLLAKGGGHIRLVDVEGVTIDLAGWGNGVAIGDWWRAPELQAGFSAQRILPGSPTYTTGLPFAPPAGLTNPSGGGLELSMPDSSEEPAPVSTCEGLLLSEILPNPVGVDAGHEFIELYNPTDAAVSMRGCELRIGDAGKRFALPDEMLQSLAHRAFSDAETGISLPNATAQSVWLLSPQTEVSVTYPNAMEDGQSWAYIQASAAWMATIQSTPGASNILLQDAVVVADEFDQPAPETLAAPCAPGKERNVITNRCRNIVSTSVASESCKSGYERNLETGRCRKVVIAKTPAPCSAEQQRNPETGRCRSVLSASTEAKPCPDGQERNAETNRCRKIVGGGNGALADVQDVRSSGGANDIRWWLAGILVSGAIGYAIYEWRQDIAQWTARLRQKIRRNSA